MTRHLPLSLSLAMVALAATACDQVANPVAPTPSLAGSAVPVDTTGPDTAQRNGQGNTPAQLTRAGWACMDVPGHGVHCLDPHWTQFGVHIQVKVFDTTDLTSTDATFLGTESLIWNEQYAGQPCLPGHGEYFLIPDGPAAGYYACHHFDF